MVSPRASLLDSNKPLCQGKVCDKTSFKMKNWMNVKNAILASPIPLNYYALSRHFRGAKRNNEMSNKVRHQHFIKE